MRQWICSQNGAREYFAVPRMLRSLGALSSLFTDIWVPPAWKGLVGHVSPRLAARSAPGLDGIPILSRTIPSLRGNRLKANGSRFSLWTDEGSKFSAWVVNELGRIGTAGAKATFGYTCANLELLHWAKENGHLAVHGQVDPGLAWYRTVQEECRRWPNASTAPEEPTQEFIDRIVAEWDVADVIIVNSDHARAGLVEDGVDASKVVVLPLTFDNPVQLTPLVRSVYASQKVLTVLFVGSISLAKGFPYFAGAAALLPSGFKFRAAGGIELQKPFLDSLTRGPKGLRVELLGHLNRTQLAAEFRAADVLVFPTLSDGFGMVQLEAQAWGKPVIATSHAGSVVIDGKTGFVVQARDAEAIAARLQLLHDDLALQQAMSEQALLNIQRFSMRRVSSQLQDLFGGR